MATKAKTQTVKAKSTVATRAPAKTVPSVKRSTAVAMAVDDDAMAKFAGMGAENVTADDVNIPRILLLQGLSPQLDSNKSEYIDGAKVGQFVDNVGEIFGDNVDFVVCHFAKIYIEWHKERGKGIQANHGTDASVMQQATKDANGNMIMPNGNVLIEHWTFYVLNLSAGGRRSTISLAKTQVGPAKDLNTKTTNEIVVTKSGVSFTAPTFYRSYAAGKSGRTNNKGSWNVWKFSPGTKISELDPEGGLLAEAVAYCEQAKKGAVNVNFAAFEGDADAPKDGAM